MPFPVFLDEDFLAQELKEHIFILRGLLIGVGFVFRHLAKGIKLLGWQQLSSVVGTLSGQTFLFDFHLAVIFSVSESSMNVIWNFEGVEGTQLAHDK